MLSRLKGQTMLSDKYRPAAWEQFVGHPRQVARVRRQLETFDRGAFWIDGPSGTGKTTLAQLICNQLGVSEWERHELDGDKCTVDAVRQLDVEFSRGSLYGEWRAVIVNEAHAMSSRAVQAWLTMLERLRSKRVVIFTTTQTAAADLFGDFSDPLLSRCIHVGLTTDGLAEAYAPRLQAIAQEQGIDGAPVELYQRLISAKNCNLRAALNAL